MCGRFSLTTPQEAVLKHFIASVAQDAPPAPPRYNICPTQPVDTIILDDRGDRLMRPLRWGFVPVWYKSLSDGPLLNNARAEGIAEKPAFRAACRRRRCLIPANGFFEWQAAPKGSPKTTPKQPWYLHAPQTPLFAFAGVWETWESPDGDLLRSCAIVTTAAGPDLAALHHREPVVIAPEQYGLWLGEEGKGAARLMQQAPHGFWAAHKVSRRVNKVSEDDADLILPFEEKLEDLVLQQPAASTPRKRKKKEQPHEELPDLFGKLD